MHNRTLLHRPVRWSPAKFPRVVDFWDTHYLPLTDTAAAASWRGRLAGLPWIQATGAAQPAMDIDGLNGHPGLQFQTDDYMTCNALAPFFDDDDVPCFAACVFKRTQDTGVAEEIFCATARSTSTSASHRPFRVGSTDLFSVSRAANGGALQTISAGVTATVDEVIVLASRHNGTTVDFWNNRTRALTASALDVASLTSNGDRASIGAFIGNDTPNAFMHGQLGFLLVAAGTPDDWTVTKLIDYLIAHFEVTV